MKFAPTLFLVLVGALGYFLIGGPGDSEASGTIDYSKANATMNDAQAEARDHLDTFLAMALNARGVAGQGMLVKVAFPTSTPDETEVIWVGPFSADGDGFEGILANEPVDIPAASDTGRVTFTHAMIRDWMFPAPDGRLFGSYTTRVMLKDLDAETAARISASLSSEPLPEGW